MKSITLIVSDEEFTRLQRLAEENGMKDVGEAFMATCMVCAEEVEIIDATPSLASRVNFDDWGNQLIEQAKMLSQQS